MDDVARELKISKKTVYKYVKDKPELVAKVMTGICLEEQAVTTKIAEENSNAIDELIEISKHVSQRLQQIHPSVHYDLEKYYPKAWEVFVKHKTEYIYSCVTQNLEKGVKQDLYRKNINIPVIAKLYISKIDMVFDPEIFPVTQFTFPEVHAEHMRYHIRGIASEKGVKYLTEKVKKENLSFY